MRLELFATRATLIFGSSRAAVPGVIFKSSKNEWSGAENVNRSWHPNRWLEGKLCG